MLFPFFMLATFAMLYSLGSAVIGWDMHRHRRVTGLQEYLKNFCKGLLYTAAAILFMAVFLKVFGAPEEG